MKKLILLPLVVFVLAVSVNAVIGTQIGFSGTDETIKVVKQYEEFKFWVNVQTDNEIEFDVDVQLLRKSNDALVSTWMPKTTIDGNNFNKEFNINIGSSAPGNYIIQVRGFEGQNEVLSQIDLVIIEGQPQTPPVEPPIVNQAPVLADIPNFNLKVGENLNYKVTAVDANNDKLGYAIAYIKNGQISTLPSGMSIDSTGRITWTPTQEGDFKFEVHVTDFKPDQTMSFTVEKEFNVNVKGTSSQPQPSSDIIYGDLNFDGKVNFQDHLLFTEAFNTKKGDAKWNPDADFNGDNKITFSDYLDFIEDFGKTTNYSLRFYDRVTGEQISGLNASENEAFNVDVRLKDLNGNIMPFSVESELSMSVFDVGFMGSTNFETVKHPLTEKSFDIKIKGNVNGVNVQRNFRLNVKDVNRLPELSQNNVETKEGFRTSAFNPERSNALEVSFVDADNDNLAISFNGNLPRTASISGNKFVWDIRKNEGRSQPYSFVFNVNDGITTVQKTLTVNVEDNVLVAFPTDKSAPRAIIGLAAIEKIENGAAVTVSAANSEDKQDYNNELSFRYDFNNDGNFDTEWKKNIEEGKSRVTYIYGDALSEAIIKLQVKDLEGDIGEDTLKVDLKQYKAVEQPPVNPPVQPPVVNPPVLQPPPVNPPVNPPQPGVNQNPILSVLRNNAAVGNQITINEGESLVLLMQGNDPDNDALRFEALGSPFGSSLNGNVFSWIPSNTQAGSYSVMFRVLDLDSNGQPKGGSDSEIIVVNVNDNLPPKSKKTVDKLEIGSVIVNGWQTVQRGDSFDITVFAENRGNIKQEDVQVTLDIPQLNYFEKSSQFDVKKGKEESTSFSVSIPADFNENDIFVIVTVDSDSDEDTEVMGFLVQ